jgi:hypothetical protein
LTVKNLFYDPKTPGAPHQAICILSLDAASFGCRYGSTLSPFVKPALGHTVYLTKILFSICHSPALQAHFDNSRSHPSLSR